MPTSKQDKLAEEFGHLNSDKFVVIFNDGSEPEYRHVYRGIKELLDMIPANEVEYIFAI